MVKLLLVLMLFAFVNADVYDGVAVVVEDKAITLLDIQKEMQAEHLDAKKASDILIRKKLEELEIAKRNISVSSAEVYDDIKKMAEANGLTISQLYDAIREQNGLNSEEFKEKIKQKLLSQKLYAAIAMSSLSEPNDEEIKEYYKLHTDKFNHPESFSVIIYSAKDKSRLKEKTDNPMFYAPDISTQEQVLFYNKISPKLANILQKTPQDHFTPILSDGKGGFMSFYIKSVAKSKETDLKSLKPQIMNAIMADKREAVLSDYFARLRDNADINIIRLPK
ncbi:peptidylprolyl isomerase [Sulfurimonas autotrophica]|uniref:SurA domain protein n=1 Tax=Sulfurimonas autotrophica (strain ATCC BAA-671 / DSM 16294 / JCM 11897 / OK10) TaxID=563040 RepID=E0URI7_SULAO|nr:peptidylprolyl isomerase [Sulfurimonas autotrophica]ADN10073.1 SurA domain protein [Sulfurimonas autotrophica DSM 16294]